MGIKVKNGCFIIDEKPGFLHSGEIHYFRLKRNLWPEFLKKMKEANLNAVSTYVPWSWHEFEEGKFDFSGDTVPERDLIGFINEVKKAGLYLILKPGPVIMAEFLDEGIPDWFLNKHNEVLARDAGGDAMSGRYITSMHPTYLDFTKKWYDHVMPIIESLQVSKGGPVGMLQVCNEVGINQWLTGKGDYSEVSVKYFREYLKNKYARIEQLNSSHGMSYKNFEEVFPPKEKIKSKKDFVRWDDWHLYHRNLYARYLEHLSDAIKGYGINTPLFHNVPGWVFGRAMEFPVCISAYSQMPSEIMLGIDHIPERVSFTNFHDDFIINQMIEALQKRKFPVFAAELQAGTREHNVRTFPNELKLFYKACFANGLRGMNYYMFCQGENPPGRGAYSHMFYWENALDVDLNEGPLYKECAHIGRWLKANQKVLVESSIDAKLGVVFYPQYFRSELLYPLFGGEKKLNVSETELLRDPKLAREKLYFETLLKILKILNVPFELVIPDRASDKELSKYSNLWVFSLDYMNKPSQEKILNYIKGGGNALISPMLPFMDENLEPCTVLMNGLGVEQKVAEGHKLSKIDIYNLAKINVTDPIMELSANKNAKTIAEVSDSGKCCGLEVNCGSGKALILGTLFSYQTSEHIDVIKKLCKDVIKENKITSSHSDLVTSLRENGNERILFLLNYSPMEIKSCVKIKIDEEEVDLGEVGIPALSGLICPVKKNITPEVSIKYALAELLEVKDASGEIELVFSSEKVNPSVIELIVPEKAKVSCSCPAGIFRKNHSSKIEVYNAPEIFSVNVKN